MRDDMLIPELWVGFMLGVMFMIMLFGALAVWASAKKKGK